MIPQSPLSHTSLGFSHEIKAESNTRHTHCHQIKFIAAACYIAYNEGNWRKKPTTNIRQLSKFISVTKLCYKPNKSIIKCVEAKAITQTRSGYQHRRLSSKHNHWGRMATIQFRSLHPALCGLLWNFSFCPHISFLRVRTRLSLKTF